MSQSLSRVVVHAVFATKGRAPSIADWAKPELYAGIAAALSDFDCVAIRVGGTSDHIHMLFALARTRTIAEVVEAVKVRASRWMKGQGSPRFAWQAGYAVFSVGERQVSTVARYIEQQEAQHRRLTFADELRRILTEHGVAFDERYLWD